MSLQKTNSHIISPFIPYRNGKIRFTVLFLLSMVVFANMYAFNNPQALQDSFMRQLKISQTQFNMLYTIIALPNIVFPFFVGIIIDYLGIRIALVSLTFMVMIFQAFVAFGVFINSYKTILIGRMLFGIGMESVSVAQTCFVSYWFLGKQLAFSLGMATTFPELGNALNSIISPLVYEKSNDLSMPIFISVGLCFVSFICSCLAAYIDRKADTEDQKKDLKQLTDSQIQSGTIQHQSIKFSDLKKLKGVFWLIILLCMFAIAQYIPFLDNVNKLLQARFCFSQISAGKNIMITYIVTSLVGLPLGIMVDRIGFKRYFTILGLTFFLISHLIIYTYKQCQLEQGQVGWSGASWGLIFLGLGYCFYANCIVPCIPMVVSKKITGTAFGIMLVIQNLAMAICPIISGQIVENSQNEEEGYKKSSLFFTTIGVCGFFLSLALLCLNKKSKIMLDGQSKGKTLKAIQLSKFYKLNFQEMAKQMTEVRLTTRLLDEDEDETSNNKKYLSSNKIQLTTIV